MTHSPLGLDAGAAPRASTQLGGVLGAMAERAGTTADAMLGERARTGALLARFQRMAVVADPATLVACDRAVR